MCGFSGELLALDDLLNVVLVLLPGFVIAPPHWPLVFAAESEILAGGAERVAFIALFSP